MAKRGHYRANPDKADEIRASLPGPMTLRSWIERRPLGSIVVVGIWFRGSQPDGTEDRRIETKPFPSDEQARSIQEVVTRAVESVCAVLPAEEGGFRFDPVYGTPENV